MGPCPPAFAIWGAKMPLCLIYPSPLAEWAFSIVVPVSCRMSFCDLASLKRRPPLLPNVPEAIEFTPRSRRLDESLPSCRMSFVDRGCAFAIRAFKQRWDKSIDPCPLPNELFRSWFLFPARWTFSILGGKTVLRGYHVQLHLYARCDKTYPKLLQMLINDHV